MEKSARKSTEISHFKGCGNGKNIFMVWDVPFCILNKINKNKGLPLW